VAELLRYACIPNLFIRSTLQKCLTTLDLTSLGVGSCVGTGMYLVAGMVARNYAGPGVVFSFIIAAVASIFSGKYGNIIERSDSPTMLRPPLLLVCTAANTANPGPVQTA